MSPTRSTSYTCPMPPRPRKWVTRQRSTASPGVSSGRDRPAPKGSCVASSPRAWSMVRRRCSRRVIVFAAHYAGEERREARPARPVTAATEERILVVAKDAGAFWLEAYGKRVEERDVPRTPGTAESSPPEIGRSRKGPIAPAKTGNRPSGDLASRRRMDGIRGRISWEGGRGASAPPPDVTGGPMPARRPRIRSPALGRRRRQRLPSPRPREGSEATSPPGSRSPGRPFSQHASPSARNRPRGQ